MFGLLSTFFLVGLCCSSVVNNTLDHKQADNEISYVESTHQKDAFSFTNYDIYSSGQLLSQENYLQYINWFWLARGIDLYSITNDYTSGFDCGNGSIFFVNSSNLTSSNIEDESVREFTCQSLEFIAKPKVIYSANNYSQQFILKFYNTLNPNWHIEIYFCYVFNSLLGGTYDWYTQGLYYIQGEDYVDYSSYLALVVKNWSNTTVSWTRQFFNYYGYDSDIGLENNYQAGFNSGFDNGFNSGYQEGYTDGFDDSTYNETATTIFNGIFTVAMLPVNVFLGFMNFEVFGINISGLVSGLITIALVFIILRFIFGGKGGNND